MSAYTIVYIKALLLQPRIFLVLFLFCFVFECCMVRLMMKVGFRQKLHYFYQISHSFYWSILKGNHIHNPCLTCVHLRTASTSDLQHCQHKLSFCFIQVLWWLANTDHWNLSSKCSLFCLHKESKLLSFPKPTRQVSWNLIARSRRARSQSRPRN